MDKYILRRPPSWDEVAGNFRTPEEQKIFQMFYLGSVADIAEYYFDSDQMQATVSSSGIIGTFRGPRDPGTGYVKLYHSMGMSHRPPRSLGLCARRDGLDHPGARARSRSVAESTIRTSAEGRTDCR